MSPTALPLPSSLTEAACLRFPSMPIAHPSWRRPAEITAYLFRPSASPPPWPAVVVLTSSAGIQRHRELYYASVLNRNGIAALVVDSFTSRGVRRTVADQTLVSAVQMEADAFGALALLQQQPDLDATRIGVMGVSKGGVAAINAAIDVRRTWRADPLMMFDAHIAICPGCTAQHRNPVTTGRPMFLMLAERDDYTPAALAIDYVQRMRRAGSSDIKIKVYAGAHHGWESLGAVHHVRDAQNWSCCGNLIEDDGRHFVPQLGEALEEPAFQRWARETCLTTGAHAGGGTLELKARATADLVGFLATLGWIMR